MIADLKKISDRSFEIWAGQFCIAKIFQDDEEVWNVMTIVECYAFPSYEEVLAWAAKKGLLFIRRELV